MYSPTRATRKHFKVAKPNNVIDTATAPRLAHTESDSPQCIFVNDILKNSLCKKKKIGMNTKIFFSAQKKMYCQNETCAAQVWQHSCYCQACFEKKWGQENNLSTIFPDCLLGVVFEYCDAESFSDLSVADLRPLLKHMPLFTIRDIAYSASDQEMLLYFAERYCFSNIVWYCLYQHCGHWYFFLTRSLKVVQTLSLAHECKFDNDIFHACMDEDSLYWFLTTNHSAQEWIQSYCEKNGITAIVKKILDWNASKLLSWFINNGFFADLKTALCALRQMIPNINLFIQLFGIHFQEFDNQLHDQFLRSAMQIQNIELLDFFFTLPKFVFNLDGHDDWLFWRASDHDSIIYDCMAKKKLVQDNWLSDWKLSCTAAENLMDHGALDHIQSATMAQFLTQRIVRLVLHQKSLFFKILPRITSFETDNAHFLKLVISSWDLCDLHCLVQHPCVTPHVTFKKLRNVKKSFLVKMYRRNPSIEMLDWIESWCDHEQYSLALCDVYAKNKLLLQHTPRNSKLWLWFQQFVVKRRSLKV